MQLAIALGILACGPSGRPAAPLSQRAPVGADAAACKPPRPPLGVRPASCEAKRCESRTSVLVQSPETAWQAAPYEYRIEVEGRRQVCKGGPPLKDCAAGRRLACEGETVATIEETGCADDFSYSHIVFAGMPCEARIAIVRGGAVLLDRAVAPPYSWVQPNGTGCPPQCLQGGEVLVIEPP